MNYLPRKRPILFICLCIVIVLGLASRQFGAVLPNWIAAHAGDALWTVAVYLTFALLFPNWPPFRLGLMAFGISVGVEFSQLIDLVWLNDLRQTLMGRLLLGAGFLWIDLWRYFVGAVLATIGDGLLFGMLLKN